MAVKIRLKRTGKKKQAHYRIVVADGRYPRNGRFIEEIGYYNPRVEPINIRLDLEKADAWVKNGAQPSETVRRLIKYVRENPETQKTEEPKKAVAEEVPAEVEETAKEDK